MGGYIRIVADDFGASSAGAAATGLPKKASEELVTVAPALVEEVHAAAAEGEAALALGRPSPREGSLLTAEEVALATSAGTTAQFAVIGGPGF